MEIRELPDYKARRYETEKYLDEPLLEYVWIVANHFFLEYDGQEPIESRRPIIFANRYIESKLSDEEKYLRYIEIYPDSTIESAKKHYAERTTLDTSFKEYFLTCKEVIKTLEVFHLDVDKFWYLLLFINDVVEDACTNAPTHGLSKIKKVNEMATSILEATKIRTEKNGRMNYETEDEYTLSILKSSLKYFIKTYNEILNISKDNEELKQKLQDLGIQTISDYVPINFDEKITLEKSHKTRIFANLFQYFLENKEADPTLKINFTWQDSTDKLVLISRLAHIVGLQGEDYYIRHKNKNGRLVLNRKLSNLLSRYKKEPLPPMTGRIYSGWF